MRQLETAVEFNMILFLFFILGRDPLISTAAVATTTTHCEYYNLTMCTDPTKSCSGREECELPTDGKRNHCFVVWRNDEKGNLIVTLKGCFLNHEECYNKNRCVERSHKPTYMFCCCEGSMCNQNFTWDPAPTSPPLLSHKPSEPTISLTMIILICTLGGLSVLLVFAGFLYWFYRRDKHVFNEIPTTEPQPLAPPSPYLGVPIQLIEEKARGRFGAVYKARYKTEEVAVKIFPPQDKQSWITEQEIYKLSFMQHPNILQFIGVQKYTDNLRTEFWLITAYHERGSLCDFLKAHTLTWPELCRVVETMTKGLMYLHEEIPAKNGYRGGKPSIAHRDFKSKNVLLKNDMTVCIADFGLALVFEPGKSCGDTHGQVGTRRYMAPEVLEGAINFTQDAFLRIDMYACGLVLWELVSRCTAIDGLISEYRLPFEEEVGQHPTLEDMQESVVQKKVRPTILQTWKNHVGLAALCDTMEECWDHDAEARLSASCIVERVVLQGRYQTCPVGWKIENDSLLVEMKESSM